MARNGSGTYTLSDTIAPSTLADANELQAILDDIASTLTLSLASDGQTVITGALQGFDGTASLPGYSFSGDLDSGFYRIGANNLGISCGATKVWDFSTVQNVSIVTLQSNGILIGGLGVTASAGVFTAPVGAVGAPSYTFAGDLDCGFYRIGANNIGAAVNGAKVLDIATTGLGVTGALTATTSITATTALSGATATGAMVGTQAQNETGTATDTLVAIGRQHFNPKHPKAWANINGTGTPAVTVGSGVSAPTDNGVGDMTINWTVAFSTADYGIQACAGSTAAGVGSFVTPDRNPSGVFSGPATTSFQMSIFAVGGAAHDSPRIHVAAWGDFA